MAQEKRGPNWLVVLLVVSALALGGAWWKNKRDRRADQERQQAEQRAEFEQQQAREKGRHEAERAFASLDRLYTRWRDGVRLADTTARIALAQPVQSLQTIHRETQDLLVPECLRAPKARLTAGMATVINGMLGFMSDRDYGRIVAGAAFAEAKFAFDDYERGSEQCRGLLKP